MSNSIDMHENFADKNSSETLSKGFDDAFDKALKSIGWLYLKKSVNPNPADDRKYDNLL